MGQTADHLTQKCHTLLLHHAFLVSLNGLHAFPQLGDVLKQHGETDNFCIHFQRQNIYDKIEFLGLFINDGSDGLFVGYFGHAFFAGLNGSKHVVHCGFLTDVFLFDTIA